MTSVTPYCAKCNTSVLISGVKKSVEGRCRCARAEIERYLQLEEGPDPTPGHDLAKVNMKNISDKLRKWTASHHHCLVLIIFWFYLEFLPFYFIVFSLLIF